MAAGLEALGPSFILSRRWTNQITFFSLSCVSLSLFLFSFVIFLLSLLSSHSLSFSLLLTRSFFLSFFDCSFLYRFLSSSFLLSPRYPTHNRTLCTRGRERNTRKTFVPLMLVRVLVCGFQLKHRSHQNLRRIILKSLRARSTLSSSLN